MAGLEDIGHVELPGPLWQEILGHCRRKIAGEYLPGESRVRRACGVLVGTRTGEAFCVTRIVPLRKNVRDEEPFKTYMDHIMEKYAVPSKTPLSRRGWITAPEELKACDEMCDREGLIIIGTYHTHNVPWAHDPLRDTPTRLDAVLAAGSSLFSFIVSLVDMHQPRIRAFYEGIREKEVPLVISG